MRFLALIFIVCLRLFAEDFITPFEYGKMLYQNPRGIGCNKCHGIKGEGTIIAVFEDKNGTKKLTAPPIYNISREIFIKKLNSKSKVMPTYFLTTDEIKGLFYYINEVNKNKK